MKYDVIAITNHYDTPHMSQNISLIIFVPPDIIMLFDRCFLIELLCNRSDHHF